MEKELQKDRWYVISAATAGTLMLKTDGADIPVEYSAGQTTFYAATGKYECDDASIIISGPFNGAPASGLGGGKLTPAEQAAVENLAAGTISHDGALNVHASSILTYGAPIDTIGGDVYHRDGSATFAGTEGGHDYSAVIDFKHFEVRKDGELIVHFHESNNEPVLELGGERVLTETGERVLAAAMSGTAASVTMQHATWANVPTTATSLAVVPSEAVGRALSMQLVMTPQAQLSTGWLTATGGAEVLWPNGGEPTFVQGYTYIVTLVQVSPMRILANVSAMY